MSGKPPIERFLHVLQFEAGVMRVCGSDVPLVPGKQVIYWHETELRNCQAEIGRDCHVWCLCDLTQPADVDELLARMTQLTDAYEQIRELANRYAIEG